MDKENTKAGSDGQGRLRIEGNLEWDGLHRPRIYYAMAATFCGLFLAVLDGTICNVALPSIASQLGVATFSLVMGTGATPPRTVLADSMTPSFIVTE